MVNAITTVDNKTQPIKNKQTVSSFNTNNIKSNLEDDRFEKTKQNNIAFKGRQYPSGYYSDEEISTAKEYINKSVNDWSDKLFNKKFQKMLEDEGQIYTTVDRVFLGFMTMGVSEIKIPLQRAEIKKRANNYVNRISNLRADLKNERLNEENESASISRKESLIIKEYDDNKNKIKEESLKPNLLDLFQSSKEGKIVPIPNCVMLTGQSTEATNDLIEWTGRNVNGKFVQVDHKDNILQHLVAAEKNYKETGNRTLLHVKNFDNLLNPSITPDHVIADLKNLMAKVSEKYHSTFIFSTQAPSKLNNITLQSHRVTEQIKVDFSSADEKISKEAWDRVTKARAGTHPVVTINDLLKYKKLKEIPKLPFDHSSYELDRAATALRKATSEYAKDALEIAIGRLK